MTKRETGPSDDKEDGDNSRADGDEDQDEKITPELSGQNTLGAAMSLSIF